MRRRVRAKHAAALRISKFAPFCGPDRFAGAQIHASKSGARKKLVGSLEKVQVDKNLYFADGDNTPNARRRQV